jgi:cell division protein FtsW
LVAKDNGSTALMILMVSLIVMVIGQLSSKYILGFLGISTVFIGIFCF